MGGRKSLQNQGNSKGLDGGASNLQHRRNAKHDSQTDGNSSSTNSRRNINRRPKYEDMNSGDSADGEQSDSDAGMSAAEMADVAAKNAAVTAAMLGHGENGKKFSPKSSLNNGSQQSHNNHKHKSSFHQNRHYKSPKMLDQNQNRPPKDKTSSKKKHIQMADSSDSESDENQSPLSRARKNEKLLSSPAKFHLPAYKRRIASSGEESGSDLPLSNNKSNKHSGRKSSSERKHRHNHQRLSKTELQEQERSSESERSQDENKPPGGERKGQGDSKESRAIAGIKIHTISRQNILGSFLSNPVFA